MWTLIRNGEEGSQYVIDEFVGYEGNLFEQIQEILDEYRYKGYTCEPIDGSRYSYHVSGEAGTDLFLYCLDEDLSPVDVEFFNSEFFDIDGDNYLQVFDDQMDKSTFLYQSGPRKRRKPLFSTSPDFGKNTVDDYELIEISAEKVGADIDSYSQPDNQLLAAYYDIGSEYFLETLLDTIHNQLILSLFNANKPSVIKEVGRKSIKDRAVEDYELIANYQDKIKEMIAKDN